MYFTGNYLRVLTPRTVDGNVPLIIDGQPMYKEAALPLSAKTKLESRNKKLPAHLRHILEEVYNHQAPETEHKVSGPVGEKKKPGPKPKQK